MTSKAQIEKSRDSLLDQARQLRDKKNDAAKKKYEEILAKAQEVYDKQIASATEKYDEFVAKVEEDTDKRLKIVNKVIDAEAEERLFKEEQIRKKKESDEREAAEQKMREDWDRQVKEQEEKKKKAAAKKKEKERQKMLANRAKVPIPPGFVGCKNSKALYAKLKKLSAGGRYSFCCFYNAKDKEFRDFCEQLSGEFNENVAWFDCLLKDMNFEEAMLLYEFNATPAVVVCREGKPSNLHRYVIGFDDDTQETLRRYADKADKD